MANTTPYIGSKISLISKAEIRYEGTLYKIDPDESTVTLSRVRSYGTEDREAVKSVPPRDNIFEYIVFKGSDIKDLTVHAKEETSVSQGQEEEEFDPAILSSAPLGQLPPAQTTAGPTMYPPSSGSMFPPPHFRPPAPYYTPRVPLYQAPPPGAPPPGMYPMPLPPMGPHYREPMMHPGPMWQRPPTQFVPPYSTSSRPDPPTNELLGPTAPLETTNTPKKLSELASRMLENSEVTGGGSDLESHKQDTQFESLQLETQGSPSSKGHPISAVKTGSSSTETHSSQTGPTPEHESQPPQPSQTQEAKLPQQYNDESGGLRSKQLVGTELEPATKQNMPKGGEFPAQKQQSSQEGEYLAHRQPTSQEGEYPMQKQQSSQEGEYPASTHRSSYDRRQPPKERSSYNRSRGYRGGYREEGSSAHHYQRPLRQGYRGQPSGSYHYQNRAPSRGGRGEYKKSIKFEGEFDFESANARFDKEGLEEEFKEKLKVDDKDEVVQDEQEELEEGEISPSTVSPAYNKTSSFFDSISREGQNQDSKSYNRGEERSLNTETFGSTGYKRGGNYRGRRGRWRGQSQGYGYHSRGYHSNRYYDGQRDGRGRGRGYQPSQRGRTEHTKS